ncbi:MAG: hypothetical protein JO326_06435 [Acetobacteraceae bacterium]|nr:hypothetical protein [Acetobacteraceae bacterium]
MKKLIFTLPALALLASTSARAQFFVQLAPVTDASTIVCANFVKEADGSWKAVAPVPFTLGIIRGIIPPVRSIKVGGYIYNNVDLYTQLNYQCGSAVVVTAKY